MRRRVRCPCVCEVLRARDSVRADVSVWGLEHTSPGAGGAALFRRAHLWTSAGRVCTRVYTSSVPVCTSGCPHAHMNTDKALSSHTGPEILPTPTSPSICCQAPGPAAAPVPRRPPVSMPHNLRPRPAHPRSPSLLCRPHPDTQAQTQVSGPQVSLFLHGRCPHSRAVGLGLALPGFP